MQKNVQMNNKYLIAIPAFNEEACIIDLLNEVKEYSDFFDVIVIDDGSSDHTSETVRHNQSNILQLSSNLGIGGAMQTAFIYAGTRGYEIVIQIDGDGQHDPRWLCEIIKPILNNSADCVIGSRYTKNAPDRKYRTPFFRKVGMVFSTIILSIVTGLTITDTTSGFRALNRKAFEFFAINYPVDHPEAEALFMLIRNGFRVVEIPITMRQRQTGTSLFSFLKAAMYPFRVIIGFLEIIIKK